MLELISNYEDGKISLNDMHYNLMGLFELMDVSDKPFNFITMFHKHWDYIEEIIAVNSVDQYCSIIKNKILLGLKEQLKEYVAEL